MPCTNTTVPPVLDDNNPEDTWDAQFDPDPNNWSWSAATAPTAGSSSASVSHPADPYSGRGIYLCGYLDLPLDYLNESEHRIVRIAVTKFQVSGLARADSSSPSLSRSSSGRKSERTIIIEPGGPGESGTNYVWEAAEDVSQRFSDGKFDVLGWDPRGVNMSQPRGACFPRDAAREKWTLIKQQYREVTNPMVQLKLVDSWNSAVFYACKQELGDFGRFLSTASAVRDLEAIRNALSESQLTGYFVSYGTDIAQTYANMFPSHVGRMILDGVQYSRDERLLGGFAWTSLDNVTDAWRDGFLGECLRAGPEFCALAAKPQGGEEEGPQTLAQLEARMDTLLRSLIDQPRPQYTQQDGPSMVLYSTLVLKLYVALYDPGEWPGTAQMLYNLEQGNPHVGTFQEIEAGPSPSAEGRPSTDELPYLVVCADSYDAPQPEPDGLLWWDQLWANMTRQSWISGNSRLFTVFPCRHFTTHWPNPAEVYRGDFNHTLRNPLLLVAQTYDPATPLRNARRLLAEMSTQNARLIVHHGYGHSSRWDRSSCTDSLGKAYILGGTLPSDAETDCYADHKPYTSGN